MNEDLFQEVYITDSDFYMSLACISSKRSKDPHTKVGACIVDDEHKIIGLGYNGMPNGCSDTELPWERQGERLDTKYPYVCHAELNAIMNSSTAEMEDSIMYTTLFPCNECAKLIIQAGVRKVIFLQDKYPTLPDFIAAKRLFSLAKVKYKKYKPQLKAGLFIFKSNKPFEILRDHNVNTKDENHISWEEYFMSVACLAAARSKMQNFQVGICIVNKKKRIVGIGHNDSYSPCEVDNEKKEKSNQPFLCNATMKAVSMRNCSSLKGSTFFMTTLPCCNCVKIIAHHSIHEIVYLNNDLPPNDEISALELELNSAGVKHRKFKTENVISIKMQEDDL